MPFLPLEIVYHIALGLESFGRTCSGKLLVIPQISNRLKSGDLVCRFTDLLQWIDQLGEMSLESDK